MPISEEQHRAAGDFVEMIALRVGSGRSIHPETAIAASARLSGSLLLRSFDFDLEIPEPGTVLLSEEANVRGPNLINLVAAFLQGHQISLDPSKIDGASENRGSEPNLDTQQSLSLLQTDGLKIAQQHSLSMQEAAEAAALATAFIVKECIPSIGGETRFNIAAYGFVEGCKTVPPRLDQPSDHPASRRWYKFW